MNLITSNEYEFICYIDPDYNNNLADQFRERQTIASQEFFTSLSFSYGVRSGSLTYPVCLIIDNNNYFNCSISGVVIVASGNPLEVTIPLDLKQYNMICTDFNPMWFIDHRPIDIPCYKYNDSFYVNFDISYIFEKMGYCLLGFITHAENFFYIERI